MKNVLKKEGRNIGISLIILLILFFSYALSLIGAYSLPGGNVEENGRKSLEIIREEGSYPHVFLDSNADRIDNFTDERIVLGAMDDGSSPLEHSAIIYGRVQYWQGFVVVIRILLNFFDWNQIRYISMLFFFALLFLAMTLVQKKVNSKAALALGGAIVSVNIVAIPLCVQFVSVFNISLISIMMLLCLERYWKNDLPFLGICFCVVGSVVNFFDFLTVPLVSLALPLGVIIVYLIENKKGIKGIEIFVTGVRTSIMWAVGYFSTYIAKWIYASLVFQSNMIEEALGQGMVRFEGESGEFVVNRFEMLRLNLETYLCLDKIDFKIAAIALAICLILLLIVCLIKRRNIDPKNWLLLILVAYPYMWYIILANHSQIHFWFTYRLQCVVTFVVLYLLLYIMHKCTANITERIARDI